MLVTDIGHMVQNQTWADGLGKPRAKTGIDKR
jgi:hypothetical protein